MYIAPILKSQDVLLSELKALLRVASSSRWTDAEIYRAMSAALYDWSGRVSIQHIYPITGGFSNATEEYPLPRYIRLPIQVQRKINRYYYLDVTVADDGSLSVWADIQGYGVEGDPANDRLILRVEIESDRYNGDDGRVIYYAENPGLPSTIPTVQTTIDADDTSVELDSEPALGPSGYIKIENEWMQYSGQTQASGRITLTNLVRGLNGTTAAGHNSAASVYIGVAAPDPTLWQQLHDRTSSILHQMYMSDGSNRETAHHEKMMVYHDERARNFWMSWTPSRPVRIELNRNNMGGYIA